MPAYHSSFNAEAGFETACAVPLLPLATSVRGPAPKLAAGEELDIIDETLKFFRANMFFSSFDVQGGGDRLLIYLTLYASQCIKRAVKKGTTKADGTKALFQLANEPFAIPGESGWKLGGFFTNPGAKKEGDKLRSYLKQAREELGVRICEHIYNEDGTPNKWWMQYGKRDFMNIKVF